MLLTATSDHETISNARECWLPFRIRRLPGTGSEQATPLLLFHTWTAVNIEKKIHCHTPVPCRAFDSAVPVWNNDNGVAVRHRHLWYLRGTAFPEVPVQLSGIEL